ncbi:nascent polypeptide-associated complex subunit alpha, muscle-specific form-like [Pogonomyrmex barbatus]|uniref:Nascent polypeptide-associated complex subunit alpha, muscle-specific form-like n=1 Tax=Pogonomyrmex barbatus TaxID=144034 RepID=A0A6I9WEU0_9HYME|nr:nascent polypeptide-associated complex subunit alpha, muscle-specific form-like [Pogonomyrmex barbatus]
MASRSTVYSCAESSGARPRTGVIHALATRWPPVNHPLVRGKQHHRYIRAASTIDRHFPSVRTGARTRLKSYSPFGGRSRHRGTPYPPTRPCTPCLLSPSFPQRPYTPLSGTPGIPAERQLDELLPPTPEEGHAAETTQEYASQGPDFATTSQPPLHCRRPRSRIRPCPSSLLAAITAGRPTPAARTSTERTSRLGGRRDSQAPTHPGTPATPRRPEPASPAWRSDYRPTASGRERLVELFGALSTSSSSADSHASGPASRTPPRPSAAPRTCPPTPGRSINFPARRDARNEPTTPQRATFSPQIAAHRCPPAQGFTGLRSEPPSSSWRLISLDLRSITRGTPRRNHRQTSFYAASQTEAPPSVENALTTRARTTHHGGAGARERRAQRYREEPRDPVTSGGTSYTRGTQTPTPRS